MKTTDTSLSKRERSALVTAAESVQQKNAACRRASNFDFLIYVLIVLLCAFSLRQFVVEPAHVAGDSMHPTLLDTEYLLVEKVSYWFNPPQRYDIVVCNYPGYTESCVKRVIGLPGETVQVKNGRILINGQRLDEEAYWHGTINRSTQPVTVPPNSVYVVGDNRNESLDSRSPSVGCIPYEEVLGKVTCVFFPFAQMRGIPAVD